MDLFLQDKFPLDSTIHVKVNLAEHFVEFWLPASGFLSIHSHYVPQVKKTKQKGKLKIATELLSYPSSRVDSSLMVTMTTS